MSHERENRNTLVMKFGGTSVGTPDAMRQAVEIVRQAKQEWGRVVVVTSALAKVTNLLLESAERATYGDVERARQAEISMREMHTAVAEALIHDPIRRMQSLQEIDALLASFSHLCQAVAVLGEASPRAVDAISSMGERMCVRLLAMALQSVGLGAQYVDASQVVITDSQHMSAHPDFDATEQRIREIIDPLLASDQVPVVTGFIGATPQGIITTLGRGGSDYSAGILGALLPADDVWIWTDVDGVMSADPRLAPAAKTIPQISYREIAELAYYGAKVLHPKTIRPVIEAGVGLRICNTFNPAHPGTRLVGNGENGRRENGDDVIKAVTAIRGQRLITIEGRGMLGVPGVAARAFGAVASTGTSVPLISQSSSEQSICFMIPKEATERVLAALQNAFQSELTHRDIDRIWATEDVAIITVVGAGMKHTPGIAGQIFGCLGERKLNVIAIAQGSSEVSISLVVDDTEAEAAVRVLHALIVKA